MTKRGKPLNSPGGCDGLRMCAINLDPHTPPTTIATMSRTEDRTPHETLAWISNSRHFAHTKGWTKKKTGRALGALPAHITLFALTVETSTLTSVRVPAGDNYTRSLSPTPCSCMSLRSLQSNILSVALEEEIRARFTSAVSVESGSHKATLANAILL